MTAATAPSAPMRAALFAWPLDLQWRQRPEGVSPETVDGLVRRELVEVRLVELDERVRPRGKLEALAVRYRPRRELYRLTCGGLAEIGRLRPELAAAAEDLQFDLVLRQLDEQGKR